MYIIDDEIMVINGAICRYLDNIENSTRAIVSQDILAHLKNLVEHVMLKYYSPNEDIENSEENIEKAVEYSQTNGRLKVLYRFRNYLDIVAAHCTLNEDSSERLMLKYYDYLLETKTLLNMDFKIMILHNLDKFPLNLDTALQEYYSKIADKVNMYKVQFVGEGEKYYIQKLKPFYVNGRRYFEVTFTTAKDRENKSGRIIAFTKLPVISNYASKFHLVNESIEVLGKTMPIILIVGWEVSIRNCEFKNFYSVINGSKRDIPFVEQRTICRYITENRFTLNEIIDFPEAAYQRLINSWRSNGKTGYFFDALDKCRSIVNRKRPGQNILRYLLYGMHNAIIKDQWQDESNHKLSNLFLNYGCIPFDKMPYNQSPINHNPRLNALFDAIPTQQRKHELLARQLRNNAEISGRMFTPVEELSKYGNLQELVNTYNDTLYPDHRERGQIIIKDDHAYINEYILDTCSIIQKLVALSSIEDANYSSNVEFWLMIDDYEVDCPEKIGILTKMFSKSAVAAIYGSAGVGKSTLINHISHFYEDKKKLFLAQTNPAIDNLKRRVTANVDNCKFSTVASFLKYGYGDPEYELLVIDECSTVNNKDMRSLLGLVKFKHILLVGDTYQINSIRFGNWFTTLHSFLPKTSVFELTKPYRTKNQRLLILWSKVRSMDDNVQEFVDKQSCSLKVDETLLTASREDEAVLCLNYDGLYGINNINRFLQESNPNPAYEWNVQQYKVGDPVLFLENNRFHPVIYNNMRGKIVDIEKKDVGKPTERIRFDIELNTTIDPDNTDYIPLQVLDTSNGEHSTVRFYVHKPKSTDEDDDGNTANSIVPFQIAYAVSIHKAQGLEYDSVKIVITDEVDELITHNIFYTAITRAQKELKIYWTPEVEKKILERIRPRNIDSDVEILKKYIGN